jgi:homoserine dehydrogenase
VTRFHVDLEVADRPGVLAQVAEAFAVHGVSIQAVHQSGAGNDARLVLVTHAARRAAIDATVADLRRLDAVRNVAGSMCVLGEER